MNDKIKSAVEIAMEKAALLDDLSDEEKQEIKNKKRLDPIMLGFYRKRLQPDTLWEKFKGEDESFILLAQSNIIDSLKFSSDTDELQRRARAVIALESLKREQKTSIVEDRLGELTSLKERSEKEYKRVFDEFKRQIENNPQARARVIEQGGAKIVIKLSVEDAIEQNQQWKQFQAEFNDKYEDAFAEILEKLKMSLT